MPTREIPVPQAFVALQVAATRYGAPFSTPAREPREKNRNLSVHSFLTHSAQFDYLLTVDDDTGVPADIIESLLSVEQDIVAAVQPLFMQGQLVANVMPFPSADDVRPPWPDWLTWEPPTVPYRVRYCGFGCVLIHRRVFESLEFPWFKEDYGDRWGRNHVTEDIYFCRKAYRAGFDIWCQPKPMCTHYKTVCLNEIVPANRLRALLETEPESGATKAPETTVEPVKQSAVG